jgi:putative transcriptional regulator
LTALDVDREPSGPNVTQRGNIMASKPFRTIEAGMRDAIAYLGGDTTKGVATIVEVPNLDVAKVREKTGLSQDRFAGAFAISPSTLRNWEQGRTRPDGAARVLLTVIDRDPEAVLKALRIGGRRIRFVVRRPSARTYSEYQVRAPCHARLSGHGRIHASD